MPRWRTPRSYGAPTSASMDEYVYLLRNAPAPSRVGLNGGVRLVQRKRGRCSAVEPVKRCERLKRVEKMTVSLNPDGQVESRPAVRGLTLRVAPIQGSGFPEL